MDGINEVPAGNVFAIGGLENDIFKSATVSTLQICPSLTPISINAKAILKVALSTASLDDAPKLL